MEHHSVMTDLYHVLRPDGLLHLVSELRNKMSLMCTSTTSIKPMSLRLVTFFYIAGAPSPGLRDSSSKKEKVLVKKGSRRILRPAVCSRSSHNFLQPRLEEVMIERAEERWARSSNKKDHMNLWFGQVKSFLRVVSKDETVNSTNLSYLEYAFVQYYEVLRRNKMSIDTVGKTAECISLGWASTESDGKDGPEILLDYVFLSSSEVQCTSWWFFMCCTD